MTIPLVLLTLGAVAVGRGLVRLLSRRDPPRRAGAEVVAGSGLLLTALSDLAAPGTLPARALGLASTAVLVFSLLLLARLDAAGTHRAERPPDGARRPPP